MCYTSEFLTLVWNKSICYFDHPVVSYLVGFASAILFFYLQFRFSTAQIRINKIGNAIKDFTKIDKHDKTQQNMLRNKYRFSLGVIINRMSCASIKEGIFPNLVDDDKDRWKIFKEYVQPVLSEISPYMLLGYIRMSGKLRILNKFCYKIQSIVEIHDAIKEDEKIEKKIKYTNKYKEYFEIEESNEKYIKDLLLEYDELNRLWKKIIRF